MNIFDTIYELNSKHPNKRAMSMAMNNGERRIYTYAEVFAAVEKYAEKLGIDRETTQLVQHMILSHHGEPEFGAAVRPGFIEAELLSELDLMDSRIYEMREAVMATNNEDFSGRIWAMDNRKLYNHNRTDMDKTPKLF